MPFTVEERRAIADKTEGVIKEVCPRLKRAVVHFNLFVTGIGEAGWCDCGNRVTMEDYGDNEAKRLDDLDKEEHCVEDTLDTTNTREQENAESK